VGGAAGVEGSHERVSRLYFPLPGLSLNNTAVSLGLLVSCHPEESGSVASVFSVISIFDDN
jgi:hypothetical protein